MNRKKRPVRSLSVSIWFGDLRGAAGCAVNFRAMAKSWRTVAEKYAPDEATRERAEVRAVIYDDCARDIERSIGPLPNNPVRHEGAQPRSCL